MSWRSLRFLGVVISFLLHTHIHDTLHATFVPKNFWRGQTRTQEVSRVCVCPLQSDRSELFASGGRNHERTSEMHPARRKKKERVSSYLREAIRTRKPDVYICINTHAYMRQKNISHLSFFPLSAEQITSNVQWPGIR